MNTLAKGFSNDFVFSISCLTRQWPKWKKKRERKENWPPLCALTHPLFDVVGFLLSYNSCNLSPAVRPKISHNVNKQKVTGGINFFVAIRALPILGFFLFIYKQGVRCEE